MSSVKNGQFIADGSPDWRKTFRRFRGVITLKTNRLSKHFKKKKKEEKKVFIGAPSQHTPCEGPLVSADEMWLSSKYS